MSLGHAEHIKAWMCLRDCDDFVRILVEWCLGRPEIVLFSVSVEHTETPSMSYSALVLVIEFISPEGRISLHRMYSQRSLVLASDPWDVLVAELEATLAGHFEGKAR